MPDLLLILMTKQLKPHSKMCLIYSWFWWLNNSNPTVTINALEAAIGCEEFVSGLSGQEFSIKINKGTQPNTKLRIPEQGMPGRGGQRSGDLIIQVEIKVPILSEEDLELPLKDILKK